ncbi:MAG TPA: disulfide bond formation protein B [Coxiellaceae bacterium]|nr:disulfide bond formation protein B [Coxiellaceae bacterium]
MNTYRLVSLLIALLTLFIVGASFYIENVLGMKACMLCLIQRACFGLLFVMSLVAFFQYASVTMGKIYTRGGLIFSLVGLTAGLRQIWLQHQPMSVADNCLPRFSYLVENMPIDKTLGLFHGKTNCSDYVWAYHGLSLASWSAIAFGVIIFLLLVQVFLAPRKKGA